MLQQILQIFKSNLEKSKYMLLTENYSFKKGKYVVVDIDNDYDYKEYIIDYIKDIPKEITNLKIIDFFGNCINSNSMLDLPGKKIHSNSIYTFFIKSESCKLDLTSNIDMYYESTLKLAENQVVDAEKNKKWILDNLQKISKYDANKDDYIRIIFLKGDSLDLHKQAYFNYLESRMWLDKVSIDKGIVKFNLTTNSDKYFLQSKLRAKNSLPYVVSQEDAIYIMLFNSYLSSVRCGRVYLDYDSDSVYASRDYRYVSGYDIEIEIKDGSAIINNIKEMSSSNNLEKLRLEEFIIVPIYPNSKYKYLDYGEFKIVKEIIPIVSKKFNDLENKAVIDSKEFLLKICRDIDIYRGNAVNIAKRIDNLILRNIVSSELTTIEVKERINILLSFKAYVMNTIKYKEELKNMNSNILNLLRQNKPLEKDDEFFYLAGQIASYLIYKKVGKKNGSLLKPLLNCKNSNGVIDFITLLYKKYGYKLTLNSKDALNRAYILLNNYKVKESGCKINYLLMGSIDKNVIYELKNEEYKKDMGFEGNEDKILTDVMEEF